MHHPASYPHQATRADVRIPLPDGAELSGRLWRPVTEQPVPAVLEYCADRLGDATVERDAQRHPWYAGHGYASLRVDARGWGSSGGVPGPEGGETEPADGLAVLDWLAAQPWCDGRIGLLGLGDGATTALRLAAQGPAAVAAVVAVCPSDDRYGEHYLGGSVRAAELPAAATARLAAAACPPDPVRVGEDWRRQWLDRLAELQPPLHGRLAHQTRDAFWAEAPLTAITAPVLAVTRLGGPGADTVLRLLERLTAPAFGIIGPWRHGYPDQGDPGPAIGFLQETLRWWDHWLRRQDTGMPAEPRLRSWLATPGESDAGHWIGDESWPSDDVREIHYDLTEALRTAGTPAGERFVTVRSPQQTGADAPWHGRPVDQRAEDGRSVCFDSAPLSEPLVLLGRPAVRLRVRLPGGVTGANSPPGSAMWRRTAARCRSPGARSTSRRGAAPISRWRGRRTRSRRWRSTSPRRGTPSRSATGSGSPSPRPTGRWSGRSRPPRACWSTPATARSPCRCAIWPPTSAGPRWSSPSPSRPRRRRCGAPARWRRAPSGC